MNTVANGKLTALVVDDMKTMRDIVRAILESMGITQIIEASNGVEALEKLKHEKVDLVICDWDMPQLCGIDVLRFARRSKPTANLPFIMLTANSKPGFVKLAVQARVDEYVTKPISAAVLERKINNVLSKMHQSAA